MSKPVSPEDVLADGLEGAEFNDRYVRKGTIRAAIENIKTLNSLTPGTAEYQAHAEALRELTPSLEALELLDHFEPRDPVIAELLRR